MYPASLGRPTDIGLQLGKACFISSQPVRLGGECFYFSSVSSFSSFSPVPLFHLSLLSLFSLSLGDNTK